jgi:hypothetical protein
MLSRQEGLTKTYNRFHDPDGSISDIQKLRDLHVEMDNAVAAAYGWSDLQLEHDFHETKQGVRFTISESARREVLARLLKLNHEHYAEEVAKEPHDKRGKAKPVSTGRSRKSKPSHATPSFLDDDEDDPDPAPSRSASSGTSLPIPAEGDGWYFAYGSNLSPDRKQERTGIIRKAIPARLSGYRLAFNKRASIGNGQSYANIMKERGQEVWGVAYLCNQQAIMELERYEGVATGHYRPISVQVITRTGEAISATTYVAGRGFLVEGARPSEDYLHLILDGARYRKLPEDYIRTIEAEARGGSSSLTEPQTRKTPIDEIDTDEVMAGFRQASRGRGWMERDELFKEVSLVLGYQRLGPKIEEAMRGHLRAAIRRRIIETDGPNLVRAGAVSMADYETEELVEVFRSVMRKGTQHDREVVIPSLARYLGFVRLTDSTREPIRKAITRAIRQGLLTCEGSRIWRVQ